MTTRDPEHLPVPYELIVRDRTGPALPFGLSKSPVVKWEPRGPQRHVRDEAMVAWAWHIRTETD